MHLSIQLNSKQCEKLFKVPAKSHRIFEVGGNLCSKQGLQGQAPQEQFNCWFYLIIFISWIVTSVFLSYFWGIMGHQGNCVLFLPFWAARSVSNAVTVLMIFRPILRWQQPWHCNNIGEWITVKRIPMKKPACSWLLNILSPPMKASFQISVNPPGSSDQCWCFCGMQQSSGNKNLLELMMLWPLRSQHWEEPLSCAQMLEQNLREAVKSPFFFGDFQSLAGWGHE